MSVAGFWTKSENRCNTRFKALKSGLKLGSKRGSEYILPCSEARELPASSGQRVNPASFSDPPNHFGVR